MPLVAMFLSAGCASPRNGAPCYALINFAPSLKVQLGGSDATVSVTETQTGTGHKIEKEVPIDAAIRAPTSLEATAVP